MLEIVLTREDANTEFALLAEWLVEDRAEVEQGSRSASSRRRRRPSRSRRPAPARSSSSTTTGSRSSSARRSRASPRARRSSRRSSGRRSAGAARGEARRHGAEGDAEGARARRAARRSTSRRSTSAASSPRRTSRSSSRAEQAAAAPGRAAAPRRRLDRRRDAPGLVRARRRDAGGSIPATSSSSAPTPTRSAGSRPSEKIARAPRARRAASARTSSSARAASSSRRRSCSRTASRSARARRSAARRSSRSGRETQFGAGPRAPLPASVRRRRASGAGSSVRFGGGGHRDPWAVLAVGDLAFVGDEAFVNVCRPVLIGREVFLTMRSLIVTHNIGHSLLEGFENRFAPVVLEDRAQVGLGAVVYAGCRIGAEAIVASSSYVDRRHPGGRVRDRRAGEGHGQLEPQALARAAGRARAPDASTTCASCSRSAATTSLRSPTATPRLRGATASGSSSSRPTTAGATAQQVVLTLEHGGGDPPAGTAVLDLLGRTIHGSTEAVVLDSVRELCRKRGIRFEPGPWRYRGGLV